MYSIVNKKMDKFRYRAGVCHTVSSSRSASSIASESAWSDDVTFVSDTSGKRTSENNSDKSKSMRHKNKFMWLEKKISTTVSEAN